MEIVIYKACMGAERLRVSVEGIIQEAGIAIGREKEIEGKSTWCGRGRE